MGQILNRFTRFVKSGLTPDEEIRKAQQTIGSKDDELRKIIEDLNEVKKQEQKKQESDTKEEPAKMSAGLAYSILDIPQNATKEQIKAAYRVKLKEYHPDKVAHLGEELKQLATKKTLQINAAYDFIKNLKDF